MCSRYTIVSSPEKIQDTFLAKFHSRYDYVPVYNAAPGQFLPVITNKDPKLIQPFRFGFTPASYKSPDKWLPNAKSDGIIHNKAFQSSIRERRCLVLANCFFEWSRSSKQPYLVFCKDQRLFAFGGIYRTWKDNITGEEINTFAIITQESNRLMNKIESISTPLILEKRDWKHWLKTDIPLARITAIMDKVYPSSEMNALPISPLVNSLENNSREVLEPIGESVLPEVEGNGYVQPPKRKRGGGDTTPLIDKIN